MGSISYDEFGRRFVEQVITADRVEATLQGVVAGSFDTGLKLAGGLVKADGSGSVTRIVVDRVAGDALTYRALLHTELDLVVRVSGIPYRYRGDGVVTLSLYAVARDDLSIFIEVPDVTEADIDLELTALGRVAAILDQLGGVNDQVVREIVRFVNQRKDEPAALEARSLDVAETIEAEWERRSSN